MILTTDIIQFNLPDKLACPKPTEERGIARDEVRLLVTDNNGEVEHSQFKNFADYLNEGDVLVVNTSATQPAAFPVILPNGKNGVMHFSSKINEREWLVEIREIKGNRNVRWRDGLIDMVLKLPANTTIKLKSKFYDNRELLHLWKAEVETEEDLQQYFSKNGSPIRYQSLDQFYPIEYFQTIFSFHSGSSEMPSAGRGFTRNLVNKLLNKGVVFAPILLHTGVSSLEENESPYPEYYEVNSISAALVNNAKRKGKRVVAVGTTAVRAIESATHTNGKVIPNKGLTDLYIKSNYQMKTVNALLTGFHEPKASHLQMLQALAGIEHIKMAYDAAIENEYYWHQFGDLHLIKP